jgi:uncharacterized protein (TIGR00251 family)
MTVRVTPRASCDEVIIERTTIRVRLHAPPVDGAANAALLALLSDRLKITKSALEIVRGATTREKMVAVTGLSAEELWLRLSG